MLIGIVGKANVGKSTFFKALTAADVLIGNYPFATIKPNQGIGFVRIDCVCKEFGVQCNPRIGACIGGQRFVPVDVMDVAGLVPGASEGKGMGNQFLDDLRQADAFIHVVDMSGTTNEKGEPSQGYDPAFDIRFLETEIDMWIAGLVRKGWDRLARQVQQGQGDVVLAISKQLSGLKVTEDIVKSAISELALDSKKPMAWSADSLQELASLIRRRTKPMLIVANKMDLPGADDNLRRCRELFPNYLIIPASADTELALKEAANKSLIDYIPGDRSFDVIGTVSEEQQRALDFMRSNVLEKYCGTGVQKALDSVVFELLKYIAVFPGGVGKLGDQHGNILPDCFLLPSGSTAFDFAQRIHTDLAKNFVAAIDVRTKRKIGRDALLKHRDVVEIMTSK
ncbi:redox-regulated ATPase YchF [Candidatus Woesearchaeota archaeon]|nr:MAG: redox-regulated ATPase YchF [Candidatus Woesearchaeota archaeon]